MGRSVSGAIATALAVVALGLGAGKAGADGVPIEPGLWEIESTTEHSMMPQPQTRTRTECIEDSELRPDFFDDPSGECRVVESSVDGPRMTWTLVCTTDAGEMRGAGQLVAEGEELRGSMTMDMEVQGQRMRMEHRWEGRRLGPCT